MLAFVEDRPVLKPQNQMIPMRWRTQEGSLMEMVVNGFVPVDDGMLFEVDGGRRRRRNRKRRMPRPRKVMNAKNDGLGGGGGGGSANIAEFLRNMNNEADDAMAAGDKYRSERQTYRPPGRLGGVAASW
jgi:hypothetical protein